MFISIFVVPPGTEGQARGCRGRPHALRQFASCSFERKRSPPDSGPTLRDSHEDRLTFYASLRETGFSHLICVFKTLEFSEVFSTGAAHRLVDRFRDALAKRLKY